MPVDLHIRKEKKDPERFYATFHTLTGALFYIKNISAYKWRVEIYGELEEDMLKNKIKIKPYLNVLFRIDAGEDKMKIIDPATIKYCLNIKRLIE